ncbi:MAG: sulfatase, partial [Myxococcales bacterium]|nr:sulfatase [Myxococcales bacterium]
MHRRLWLAGALSGVLLAAGLLLRRAPSDDGVPGVPSRPAGRPPNVVVYLVDTLRADHLGVYGYERPTSPVLDRWAAQSVVFDRAYAPSSWTRPSVVSLLSGLDPIRHGVEDRLDVIPDDVRLLSEQLRSRGYATFAAVTNPNVLPEWGFGQGFDVFEDLDPDGQGTRADAVSDWVVSRMPELAARQPFLLYLHLLDPHAPYEPPAPYDERFPRIPALPANHSIGRYDGEIAFVDAEFGRSLDALAERGLADDTLVIFLSDHGEELMDHGQLGHGATLFEEVVRVPLILRLPRGAHAGARVATRVSLIDVFPTVLGLLGLPPAPGLDGRDLSPLLDGRGGSADLAGRDLFLSLYTTGTRSNLVRGVLSGEHKYLRRSRPEASEALFDLARDPEEYEDRAALDAE